LKTEAANFSEKLVPVYKIILRNISEDIIFFEASLCSLDPIEQAFPFCFVLFLEAATVTNL
jgi:hypothetical protein